MKFNCNYVLERPEGRVLEKGHGAAALTEGGITLAPSASQPLDLPWEQIFALAFSGYKARLTLRQDALTLGSLGYKFDDFCRHAARLRNERLLTLGLAGEPLKQSMIEAHLDYRGPAMRLSGGCELRIYETSLVALPETGDFLRLPFRCIKEIKEGDYVLEIASSAGETWLLSGLGGKFGHLKDSLRAQMGAMELLVHKALAEAMPGADPLGLRAAVKVLGEGRLLPLEAVERELPGFKARLQARICSNEADAAEYRLLKKLSSPDMAAFGVKKGLMGSLSGDHYLFVFGFEKPARAAAVEAFAIAPKGAPGAADRKATYFYRLPPGRGESWTEFLDFFNRAMTAVNFRRMPILLPDERLADPRNAVYAEALARVPELKVLRGLYIGRLIHCVPEQWAADASAILEFAAKNSGAGARWKKTGETPEETEEKE